MAISELSEELRVAGELFYKQIKQLGLHPEACLWTRDEKGEMVLTLVWSGVDKYGPYQLSKLIFEAFRKTILPSEIDPFWIDVRSPKDLIGQVIVRSSTDPKWYRVETNNFVTGKVENPFTWHTDWVYHIQNKNRKAVDISRDWRRFQDSIAAAA